VSSVTNMRYMFQGASSFNHTLCGAAWVHSTADKRGMFVGSPGSIGTPTTPGASSTTNTITTSTTKVTGTTEPVCNTVCIVGVTAGVVVTILAVVVVVVLLVVRKNLAKKTEVMWSSSLANAENATADTPDGDSDDNRHAKQHADKDAVV